MIKLVRTTDVALIPASLAGAARLKKNKELLEQQLKIMSGQLAKVSFNSNYWKAAKNATRADAFNKCAYCESPTAVVAHGDIEHFRPKAQSQYWWLAYTYYNYCFCCQICNQSYKGDNFPISGIKWPEPKLTAGMQLTDEFCGSFAPDPLTPAAGLSLDKYIALHTKEKSGLPDPYLEDAEKYFGWKADDVTRQVFIAPRNNRATTVYRFKSVTDYFGLNRKELLVERYRVYRTLKRLKALLKAPGLTAADKAELQVEINSMLTTDAPYAGMCRWFAKKL